MRQGSSRLSARQRGYGSAWDKARKGYLRARPLCAMCMTMDMVTHATVVDHIKPHRGDQALFWDKANWQSLCKTHHDSTKKRDEARGTVSGAGLSGDPIDPKHHWNV